MYKFKKAVSAFLTGAMILTVSTSALAAQSGVKTLFLDEDFEDEDYAITITNTANNGDETGYSYESVTGMSGDTTTALRVVSTYPSSGSAANKVTMLLENYSGKIISGTSSTGYTAEVSKLVLDFKFKYDSDTMNDMRIAASSSSYLVRLYADSLKYSTGGASSMVKYTYPDGFDTTAWHEFKAEYDLTGSYVKIDYIMLDDVTIAENVETANAFETMRAITFTAQDYSVGTTNAMYLDDIKLYEPEETVEDPEFTVSSPEISGTVAAGNTVSAAVTCKNTTDTDEDITVVIALYKGITLIDMNAVSQTVTSGTDSASITASVTVPTDTDAANCMVKAFVVDGTSTLNYAAESAYLE